MRFEDLEFVNFKNIIEAIQNIDSPSRANVAKVLGLSKTTVSYVVSNLIEKEIVVETEAEDNGKRGRPGLGLKLNEKKWSAIGASFDSNRWSYVRTTLSGKVISKELGKLVENPTPETMIESLVNEIKEHINEIDEYTLPAIGLGLPGIVDTIQNRIIIANDLKWHNQVNIGEIIENELKLKVFSANRFTAAGLAEFRYANPNNEKNLIYIGLGHGIRSAIFIDGRLLQGETFSAGRVSHIVVDENGPLCDCGKRGCLLTVANSEALEAKANELRKEKKYLSSRLNSENIKVDADTICRLADEYDSCAMAALDSIVVPLSKGLGEICDIVNPKKLIIGGQLGSSSQYLVSKLRENMESKMSLELPGSHIQVEQAKLRELGSALGAASLVLENKAELLFEM